MIRDPRANPVGLAVLVCLYEQPMHPYEVAQTLRERHKHESIRLNYGSLYGVVKNLDGAGLIEPDHTSREGRRPRRTVYRITEAGRREMQAWLSELVARPVKEYLHFEAALSLIMALPPSEAAELLRRRATNLEHQIVDGQRELEQVRAQFDLPRVYVLEADYMFMLLQAEFDWVQRIVAEIDAGELDGLDQWHAAHNNPTSPNDAVDLTPGQEDQ